MKFPRRALLPTLQSHGIGQTEITKLFEGGFSTVESVAHSSMKVLLNIKGISDVKGKKIKEAGE